MEAKVSRKLHINQMQIYHNSKLMQGKKIIDMSFIRKQIHLLKS